MLLSAMLEEYLTRPSGVSGGNSGRLLKDHAKAAARSSADEFLRSGKTHGNRQHYRMTLMGAGVHDHDATEIASREI